MPESASKVHRGGSGLFQENGRRWVNVGVGTEPRTPFRSRHSGKRPGQGQTLWRSYNNKRASSRPQGPVPRALGSRRGAVGTWQRRPWADPPWDQETQVGMAGNGTEGSPEDTVLVTTQCPARSRPHRRAFCNTAALHSSRVSVVRRKRMRNCSR